LVTYSRWIHDLPNISGKRVHITGRDGYGWSIDHDRANASRFLTAAGIKVVGTSLTASAVHSVWWRTLFGKKGRGLRIYAKIKRQKFVGTATNEFEFDDEQYLVARKFINLWVAGNRGQQTKLLNDGVKAFWQPFYVDENMFLPSGKSKEEMCIALGIDYQAIKDRYLISNFQRDTLASDLKSPKLQKDPERLVRILSQLPHKNDWLLFIAGPRRHYVVAECERLGVPYYLVGSDPEPGVDDIRTNIHDGRGMAMLNELADCSLTTSKWEGGPKAILEGAYALSYVLTTSVGNAPDIFPEENLFDTDEMAISKLTNLVENNGSIETTDHIKKVQSLVLDQCGYEPTLQRWRDIYNAL
jgi:hypothetical protein